MLSLTRQKSQTRLDLTLPANWTAFASYSRERRDGRRPFGAVFGGGGGGGNLEIPESIDDSMQNVLAGLQFAGTQTNLTLQTVRVDVPKRRRRDDLREPVVHHHEHDRGRPGDDVYARADRPLPKQQLLQRSSGGRAQVSELLQEPRDGRGRVRPVAPG